MKIKMVEVKTASNKLAMKEAVKHSEASSR